MIALWLALAFADDSCTASWPPVAEALSVAWVAPAGKRVGGGALLDVVPTSEIRDFLARSDADTARLLQHLGLRRSDRAPRRAWMVTVFEVRSDELCRPVDPLAVDDPAGGVSVCDTGTGPRAGRRDACGVAVDRAGGSGPAVYHLRWRDAARRGFCVLPADRFVVELQGTDG